MRETFRSADYADSYTIFDIGGNCDCTRYARLKGRHRFAVPAFLYSQNGGVFLLIMLLLRETAFQVLQLREKGGDVLLNDVPQDSLSMPR